MPTTTPTSQQQDHFFDLACGGLVIDLVFCCSKHGNSPLTPYQRGIAHGHDESAIARFYYDRAAGYAIGDVDAFMEGLGQGDGGELGAGPFFTDQAAAEAK